MLPVTRRQVRLKRGDTVVVEVDPFTNKRSHLALIEPL